MRIAVSSDMYTSLIGSLLQELRRREHAFTYFGPQEEQKKEDWTTVTKKAIEAVKKGQADEAIVLCWTGTGATILANKYPGIRAALCFDGETAKGARVHNHANVLGMSLHVTTPERLDEILNAWFDTPFSTDSWNLSQINVLKNLD